MSRRIKYRFDDSMDYKLLSFANSERVITAKKLSQLIWAKEQLSGYDFGIQLIDAKTKKELDGDEEVYTCACVIVKKVYDDINEPNKRPKSGKNSAKGNINPVRMARSTCADAGLTREEALSNAALKPALDFYVAKPEASEYGGGAVPEVSSAIQAPLASTITTSTYRRYSVETVPINTSSFHAQTTSVATTSTSDYSQPQFATSSAADVYPGAANSCGNSSYGFQPAYNQYSPPTSSVNPYTAWLQQYVQPGGHNVQAHHSSHKPFQCEACRVYFESSERLQHHERVSHSSS
ncbi:hypothetical protein AAVH_39507, partial [Aphelenchoides avenae]